MDFNENRAAQVVVVAWVFTGIAIATVFLKLFTRARITMRLGWDDFFIFLSLVGSNLLADTNLGLIRLRFLASSPPLS